jgi:hypothetical protein
MKSTSTPRSLRTLAVSLLALGSAASAFAGITWSEDFNDKNSSTMSNDFDYSTSTGVAGSTVYDTPYCWKLTIQKADKRAELSEKSTTFPSIAETRYYGFALQPLSTFTNNTTEWTIVSQFVQWYSTIPDWANHDAWNKLVIENGKWKYIIQYGSSEATRTAVSYDLGAVTVGKWVDFVIKATWQPNDNGRFQLWMRAQGSSSYTQKIDRSGPVMMDVTRAPYLKLGLYKGSANWPGSASSMSIAVDSVKVGGANSSMTEVSPPVKL